MPGLVEAVARVALRTCVPPVRSDAVAVVDAAGEQALDVARALRATLVRCSRRSAGSTVAVSLAALPAARSSDCLRSSNVQSLSSANSRSQTLVARWRSPCRARSRSRARRHRPVAAGLRRVGQRSRRSASRARRAGGERDDGLGDVVAGARRHRDPLPSARVRPPPVPHTVSAASQPEVRCALCGQRAAASSRCRRSAWRSARRAPERLPQEAHVQRVALDGQAQLGQARGAVRVLRRVGRQLVVAVVGRAVPEPNAS